MGESQRSGSRGLRSSPNIGYVRNQQESGVGTVVDTGLRWPEVLPFIIACSRVSNDPDLNRTARIVPGYGFTRVIWRTEDKRVGRLKGSEEPLTLLLPNHFVDIGGWLHSNELEKAPRISIPFLVVFRQLLK